jgi:hypothetical protein
MRIKIGDIVEINSFNPKRRTRTAVILEHPKKRPHVGHTVIVLLDGEITEVLRDSITRKIPDQDEAI